MLLGYGAKNCWCFKEWMEIDLTLDDKVPTDISMNLPAATAMCLKGANASGKTNALKVFAFISDFATNSFNYPIESEILFDTYFMNNDPSEFYVNFETNGNYYSYEFTVTKHAIIEEHLFRKLKSPKSRTTEIFTRKDNNIVKNTLYSGHSDIIFKLNSSFISTLHQYGLDEIDEIYNFLHKSILNVTYMGLNNYSFEDIDRISKIYLNDPDKLLFAKEKIHMFDTGIVNIEIRTRKDEDNNDIYFPVFYHEVEDSNNVPFLLQQESSGTRKLFCNLLLYKQVLDSGAILVLDEFDINLHPDILPHIIKLFIKQDNNLKNAQIILTTYNSDIMDLLSKYRTYLFEKDKGESYCYRLDETNLRNDRPISVPYKKGLLGGVPKIDTEA